MDLSYWLQLLKQYGPWVGLFIAFIIWQTRRIDHLLDRNSSIYEAEIRRLADVQNRLLSHILGPQPSSANSPTIREVQDGAKLLEGEKPEGLKKGG